MLFKENTLAGYVRRGILSKYKGFNRYISDNLFSRVNRFFTKLTSAGSQYYTIPTVTATGDFDQTFKFATTITDFRFILTPNDISGNSCQIVVNGTNGQLLVELDNGTQTIFLQAGNNVNDGQLHTGRLRRVGDTYFVSVDSGTEVSGIIAGVNITYDLIGRNGQTGPTTFNGFISDVNFISGFTQVGGGTNPTYNIDDDFSKTSVLRNSNTVLGSELGNIVSIPSGWTDQGDGSYDWSSPSNNSEFSIGDGQITENTTYLVSFNVTNFSGTGNFGVSATTSSDFQRTRIEGNGTITAEIAINSGQTSIRLFARASHTLTVSDISIRQADGYGTAVNITASEQFTEQADGDWLGNTELWDIGPSVFDGSEAAFRIKATLFGGLVPGSVYSLSVQADITTGVASLENFDGSVKLFNPASEDLLPTNITATGGSPRTQTRNVVPTVGSITPSFKLILQVA